VRARLVWPERDSAEVSRAKYTVTGLVPPVAGGTAGVMALVGSSEVSMALQIAFGKGPLP
jgi:hypothetical protein